MDNNRFEWVTYFHLKIEEPRASWSQSVEAIGLNNSSRRNEKYIIFEFYYSFACYSRFRYHVYESEGSLRQAYQQGLLQYVKRQEKYQLEKKRKDERTPSITDILQEIGSEPDPWFSSFENHPGLVKTIQLSDFEKPWFLAEHGQKIIGNRAFTPKKPKKRT